MNLNPVDFESQLIKTMNEILENQKTQEKTFFQKLLDSLPGVLIAVITAAFLFYMNVNIEISKMKDSIDNLKTYIVQQEKRDEDRIRKLEDAYNECYRRIINHELNDRNKTSGNNDR